ncbi:MAG: hypothetical protein P9X24_01125 [Candidatus Hatepunaea meridiana]|nr:hypothetical protein [Candidatus Hatepunaea meridiana]
MIKINKSSTAPEILRNEGKDKRRALCEKYDSGSREFSFDGNIYRDDTVKEELMRAQNGKCCFCEEKFRSYDVEHFRPKGGFRQKNGDTLEKPGYYWLAYEWDNLFLACPICNQRFKKNLFPLADPTKRARNHHGALSEEEPLLIDPSDNPGNYISFREEICVSVGGNIKGNTTIEILGLNHEVLIEKRKDRLEHIKDMFEILELSEEPDTLITTDKVKRARTFLDSTVKDSAPFAAMARAAINSNFNFA